MNRIKLALLSARKSVNELSVHYDYKLMLPVSILLLLLGYFINNIFGDILLFLGLFGSPLIIYIQGFWSFVIYLIKPK